MDHSKWLSILWANHLWIIHINFSRRSTALYESWSLCYLVDARLQSRSALKLYESFPGRASIDQVHPQCPILFHLLLVYCLTLFHFQFPSLCWNLQLLLSIFLNGTYSVLFWKSLLKVFHRALLLYWNHQWLACDFPYQSIQRLLQYILFCLLIFLIRLLKNTLKLLRIDLFYDTSNLNEICCSRNFLII